MWNKFSKKEILQAIKKCNNSSALGPDKLSWRHIKMIIKNNECIVKLLDIANTCIDLGHWPNHFKISTTIIIPKPNKQAYDMPKFFRPIVLLNILEKLFEKMIGECLQFHSIFNNFVHQCQLGGLKHRSTTDVGVALTYFIRTGWVKNLTTSTLAFDIAQFFLSLNHQILLLILKKARFNIKVLNFFKNYLINRKMTYLWNNFSSPIHNMNVSIGQGSALSPILSALYLSPIFYILEKRLKNLKIPVSILFFVDDGLFISQNVSLHVSNTNFFCSYNIVSNLLTKFGLVIEHGKTEVFHFSRQRGEFNPPPLDLTPIGGSVLHPKDSWQYLGFYFNRKLLFKHHINFYSHKAISTVKCMKMLGNLSRGLIPLQKCCLYKYCVLPIALYGFQAWYYNKVPLNYPLKILRKLQQRAALWISGVFQTSPSGEIETISGLIPIYLHIKKLYNQFLSRGFSLPHNHIIKAIIFPDNSSPHIAHNISLNTLTLNQRRHLNSPLIDMDNKKNEFAPSFDPFNHKFSPENHLIDSFSDRISFHP